MKPARPKRTRHRAAAKAARPALSPDQMKALQEAIGYRFKQDDLLLRAMTHPSAVPAARAVQQSNQRLEFLGDRVLNLLIAERLITRRRDESEGDLAPRLNRLVKKGACADAVRHLGLHAWIILSDGEVANGGRDRESTLGDACEAIIGAIYLDGGLNPARAFVERAFGPQMRNVPAETKDPKTLLQEWAQGRGHDLPDYTVTGRTGPDHDPSFDVEVRVNGGLKAAASGTSKREAERAAAAILLKEVTS